MSASSPVPPVSTVIVPPMSTATIPLEGSREGLIHQAHRGVFGAHQWNESVSTITGGLRSKQTTTKTEWESSVAKRSPWQSLHIWPCKRDETEVLLGFLKLFWHPLHLVWPD